MAKRHVIYRGETELDTGEVLSVKWRSVEYSATFLDPSESDDEEPTFYLDDVELETPLSDAIPEEAVQWIQEHAVGSDYDPRDDY